MEKWMLAIIAIVIGALLKPVGEYLVGFLIYHFGEMKVRKLPPKWKTIWSYLGEDESEEGDDILEIRQIGPLIAGRVHADIHDYVVKGRLYPDGTIEGTWKTRQAGKSWYGTFHLLVDLDAETVRGKWIGKLGKDPGKIRSGDWTWKKV